MFMYNISICVYVCLCVYGFESICGDLGYSHRHIHTHTLTSILGHVTEEVKKR